MFMNKHVLGQACRMIRVQAVERGFYNRFATALRRVLTVVVIKKRRGACWFFLSPIHGFFLCFFGLFYLCAASGISTVAFPGVDETSFSEIYCSDRLCEGFAPPRELTFFWFWSFPRLFARRAEDKSGGCFEFFRFEFVQLAWMLSRDTRSVIRKFSDVKRKKTGEYVWDVTRAWNWPANQRAAQLFKC